MAITKWDEYLVHQTYDTIDAGPVEVDRLILCCHNAEGTLHLVAGLGTYPHANIMDGYVIVRHKDVQHNLRLSRHLQGDRADTRIGPLTVEVIEPLKCWGLYLDKNDFGISCSLEFEARAVPYLSNHPALPFFHYTQLGRYQGNITLDGQKYYADGFVGVRDRSWRGGLKMFQEKKGFHGGHIWIQAHFDKFCFTEGGFPVWEIPKLQPVHMGAIFNDDGSIVSITDVRHRIAFTPTVLGVTQTELLLKDTEGKERHLIAKPISAPVYYAGGDYAGQGLDKGPLNIEGEQWNVSRLDEVAASRFGYELYIGNQYIAEFKLDGESGVGILEHSYCSDKEQQQYKPTW
jgi:hypothetical protein